MMHSKIAIVGLACRYPDASTPQGLWENVLGQRRAFRRIPDVRLRLDDYHPDHGDGSDSVYVREAALIDGYDFDRIKFRVGGSSFRVTDLAHWMALEVAAEALDDAGFRHGPPKDGTGVLVGNTLTSEFTRARTMRLRWPYVHRQTAAALQDEGWDAGQIDRFLSRLEARYKEPFPANNDESLAGGLANTIAGRIANHFDLHGGGYTLDGACASSLLAVNNACSAIALGDLDAALVGGVDLSLDPFELVGFSRLGALAKDDMRVYDRRPTGFLPGEGCGFAVLMRHEDAVAQGLRIYGLIRGWGISSDGGGGLTRPEVDGQALALQRTYRRAGYGIDAVAMFEGHGTGTPVGDEVELGALQQARRQASPSLEKRAALGSIKANIGHTKAAAGLAGLIKVALAVHHRIIPPMTGCSVPHPMIEESDSTLRIPRDAEPWSQSEPLRAGLSAMGFGGINTHLTVESANPKTRRRLTSIEKRLVSTPQDAEILFLAGRDREDLEHQIDALIDKASQLSRAELTDLAAESARRLSAQSWRAAVIASRPESLADKLRALRQQLDAADARTRPSLNFEHNVFLAQANPSCRVGFLFPGQASPSHLDGGAWRGRFPNLVFPFAEGLGADGDASETATAQPAIVAASLAGLSLLESLGVEAEAALGHSLGELVALHWAGALDANALRHLAEVRGRAMSEYGAEGGAMASLLASAEEVDALLNNSNGGQSAVIASYNGDRKTVIAGPQEAIESVIERARQAGTKALRLPVSHAFHSPLMTEVIPHLRDALSGVEFTALDGQIASTITGSWLDPEAEIPDLLCRQITDPVRFTEALEALTEDVDILIEVGPGHVLTGQAKSEIDVPVVSIDAGGPSLSGLLQAVGALFVTGATLDPQALFHDRFSRPFDLDRDFDFLVNPCELAAHQSPPDRPIDRGEDIPARVASLAAPEPTPASPLAVAAIPDLETADPTRTTPLDVVQSLLAARTELPIEALRTDSRLLTDLHLSSIAVSELVTQAAQRLGMAPPVAPTEYANATLGELADALSELASADSVGESESPGPSGLAAWVHPFASEWVERPLRVVNRPANSPVDGPTAHLEIVGEHSLRPVLERRWSGEDRTADGLLVFLSDDANPLDTLIAAGQKSLRERYKTVIFVERHGSVLGTAAFARTLHLESPGTAVRMVTLPPALDDEAVWAERLLQEAASARGFQEVRYSTEGCRSVPILRALPPVATVDRAPLFSSDDVLVVSGGGKGIGAESALALTRRYGVRLVLLGRSRPDQDAELRRNLERLEAAAEHCLYRSVDVGDADAVRKTLHEVAEELGPIRAILHSAGTNVPKLIDALERSDIDRTLRPKVRGLENLLAAVDPADLKLLVGFGSIIGRMGLRGQADYALANQALSQTIEQFAATHPTCRGLCLEWSVWSGVGMGARLADLDLLARQGITPISPEDGLATFLELIERETPVSLVVAGRFGEPSTLEMERPELPLRRFLENPRLHVPGVELVVEAELSTAKDPYLADHTFEGEPLFPAVFGVEAMVQSTLALLEIDEPARVDLRQIHFKRPVVVPPNEPTTVRLAALVRGKNTVEVALRSSRTAFQMDHFRATIHVEPEVGMSKHPSVPRDALLDLDGALQVKPQDLYGPILFQKGRFERVLGYRHLRATECLAEIAVDADASWFGGFLPTEMALGDPGARDASIHAVQACIPHATVLPVALESLSVFPGARQTTGTRRVVAKEKSCHDQTLIYDLEIWTDDDQLVEIWRGLELHTVESRQPPTLAAPLLGPYLERRLKDLLPSPSLRVAATQNGHYAGPSLAQLNGQPHGSEDPLAERRARGERAVELALGHPATVHRRPDGKPEIYAENSHGNGNSQEGKGRGIQVSIAHCDDLALAMVADREIGCDLEAVTARPPETWQSLLGARHQLIDVLAADLPAESTDAPHDLATRVWTALEGLKKAGSAPEAPLTYSHRTEDGWMFFKSGDLIAATVLVSTDSGERLSVAAVIGKSPDRPEPN